MVSLRAGRAKTSFAVAYLLSLAALVIASSRASAGCEHGVTSGNGDSSRFSQSHLEALEASGALACQTSQAPSRRKLPCSGPACREGRRSSHFPALSSPVRTVSRSETTVLRREDDAATDFLGAVSSTIHPRHHTFPLERPPPNHSAARTFLSDQSRRVASSGLLRSA